MPSSRLTLAKSDRICSRSQITGLFSSGSTLFLYPFKVFFTINDSDKSRFLISVPKKSFKRAVHRNYIKRLVREALRIKQFSSILGKGVNICLIYSSTDIPNYTFINNKIENVLEKINKRIEMDSDSTLDTIG